MLISIKDSPIHGKGVFAEEDINADKRWTFQLEKVCCQSHCFVEGITENTTVYLGTFDWPFYINSTWPDTMAANLSFEIEVDSMALVITTEQSIKIGKELTLPYDWTIHMPHSRHNSTRGPFPGLCSL